MSTATALKLQDAGFNRQQVEALVALVEAETVTKADLVAAEAHLENKIDRLIAEIRAEIAAVRSELKAEIAGLRSDIRIAHYIGGVAVTLLVAVALKVFFG